MTNLQLLTFLYLLLFAAFLVNCHSQEKKVYVVYMGEKQNADISVASVQQNLHYPILERVLGSSVAAKESLVYSYGRSFNGFAAKLSDEEVARFSDMEGVVSVLPNTMLQLHTTRSWDFIGLPSDLYVPNSKGEDVIIGMIDSGIWPESQSFSDEGFGPPPAKWRGKCITENNFSCNNKIIGARYYNHEKYYIETDIKSPRDPTGHGTHTASIAAGREVRGASYFGHGKGIARGGAPNARIAVYKACWYYGCSIADILAAFDDAIADGVDVISVSFGVLGFEYTNDPVAIGSFHALRKGILTISSAGNFGPSRALVSNCAPWLLTVGASTMDRKFITKLVLGNGQIFTGVGINSFNLNGTQFPLIWGGDAANYSANSFSLISKECHPGELNSHKIKGKIVLCEQRSTGLGVLMAEGAGIIMPVQTLDEPAFPFSFPATSLTEEEITKVLGYIRSSEKPVATILVAEAWKDNLAPIVAPFSARGPNLLAPDVLKPDLVAPGAEILAAWSPVASPSIEPTDTRTTNFFLNSGTSMSCPHVTGVAANLKTINPTWSPAAIKSALMTTSYTMDPKKHENEREFAYGSGLLNPSIAGNPGLVYDAIEKDYVNYLCKQGYNTTRLRLITGDKSVCKSTKLGRGWDLNYPSFSLPIEEDHKIQGKFTRTVTNVGSPNTTYHVAIEAPELIEVTVKPSVLSFTTVGEKKSFVVNVSGPRISQVPIISCSVIWGDGLHSVRTPLVIYTVLKSENLYSPTQTQSQTSYPASTDYFTGF